MLFNSSEFIFLFLPVVVSIYYLLNRHELEIVARIWLVCASLFFYAYWNVSYLALILISLTVNFILGTALDSSQHAKQAYQLDNKHRKSVLIGGVIFNIGLLGYYKYADFFITNLIALTNWEVPLLQLTLPLAISFFTFQQIAYLVDCYQEKSHEHNLLTYSLFVTFFPQLIAGPIVHHREMMPQFKSRLNSQLNWQNLTAGCFIFSIGLFKKVVIADTFAEWANTGYSAVDELSTLNAWATSLSYTMQLYFDFSGYTDMAVGAALMFNIHLPINFNSPYKALNIRDFWRRWHITLSRWLRDYVYIPLGGSRKGLSQTHLNLLVTFLLGGLWHGAGWTFIIWGLLHGLALSAHRIWGHVGLSTPKTVAWLLTFLFVNTTWVFFRAEDIPSALIMLDKMFLSTDISLNIKFVDSIAAVIQQDLTKYSLSYSTDTLSLEWGLVASLLVLPLVLGTKNSMEIKQNLLNNTNQNNLSKAFLYSAFFALGVIVMNVQSSVVFLYFNF